MDLDTECQLALSGQNAVVAAVEAVCHICRSEVFDPVCLSTNSLSSEVVVMPSAHNDRAKSNHWSLVAS